MKIYPHLSAERLANVYLVVDDEGTGLIVDPAHIDKEIIEHVESCCRNLAAVLITHRHITHTEGLGTLTKIYSVDIYSASDEINRIKCSRISDGSRLRIGNLDIEAISVPGHSMDSLVYRIDGGALFTGDTLLSGSIATTHSHIEKELLVHSICTKLLTLPDTAIIYPGHGALSKLRIEKMFNHDLLESADWDKRNLKARI